jgi:hypothetical protein
MKIRLQVTPIEGDPYECETNLFVVVAWERKFKRQASSLANGIGAEDLAFFAFESARAAGITTPLAFDEFIKKTKSIDVVSEDAPSFTEAAVTDAH